MKKIRDYLRYIVVCECILCFGVFFWSPSVWGFDFDSHREEIDSRCTKLKFIEMEFEGNDTGFLLSEIEMRAWFSNVVEGKNGGGRGVVIG
nr:hypothetical protein Itr_chr06CG11150 [Ipomoea trifida]GMC79368.1 hypothetical protein Iba_chr04aCG10150 [Ipomoea batatas]GMD08704.1 hypothetical protein Iba_chr06dCG1060 [Ipomoea batatas]GMD11227.1 hypothetical protein Iba_scaffold40257CG0460 [Ipomoea batatas]GMD35625.1 hypothetical protein Iba_chr09dCG8710 [Ipomoea batatas]